MLNHLKFLQATCKVVKSSANLGCFVATNAAALSKSRERLHSTYPNSKPLEKDYFSTSTDLLGQISKQQPHPITSLGVRLSRKDDCTTLGNFLQQPYIPKFQCSDVKHSSFLSWGFDLNDLICPANVPWTTWQHWNLMKFEGKGIKTSARAWIGCHLRYWLAGWPSSYMTSKTSILETVACCILLLDIRMMAPLYTSCRVGLVTPTGRKF